MTERRDFEDFSLLREGLTVWTEGLATIRQRELRATVRTDLLLPTLFEFCEGLARYVLAGNTILPTQTVRHGYWVTKFMHEPGAGGGMPAWERTPDAEEWQVGVELAMSYWYWQTSLCEHVGAEFDPFPADQLVSVPKSLLGSGRPITGWRVKPTGPNSGWQLMEHGTEEAAPDRVVEHAYHVTARRPEVVECFGLPPGYNSVFNESPEVWFDPADARR